MLKHCPSCGVETQPGARFCRRCGAPLRNVAGGDGDTEVSPHSATVPLRDEGRTTDGLAPDDPRRASAADTSRVRHSELERLLHAPNSAERAPDADAAPPERQAQDGEAAPSNTAELEPPAGEDFGLKTRASFTVEQEEDLTVIAAPRAPRPFETDDGARRVEPTPSAPVPPPTVEAIAPPVPAPPSPSTAALARRRVWPYVLVGVAVLLLFAVAAALLAFKFLRRPAPTEISTPSPQPPPDAAQLFDEKLAQAEAHLAAGQMDAAQAALREANQLDPSNWKAHRRLGELLWESGQRREAIDEYARAAANNSNDFTLWRALAAAQLAEGLYPDAAESYRRLVALVGEAAADPNDLLSFADALRQSGRADEARALYQKLISAQQPEVAAAARQRLAELAQASPTPSPGQRSTTAGREEETPTPTPQPTPTPRPTTAPTPPPTPTPAPPPRPVELSPADSYQRGAQLWSSNRGEALALLRSAARGGNVDAHYYLGLSYVEGRDMGRLNRAEIVAALQHFQNAQRGQHGGRARQYAQQLEKEFDRIRKQ